MNIQEWNDVLNEYTGGKWIYRREMMCFANIHTRNVVQMNVHERIDALKEYKDEKLCSKRIYKQEVMC